INEGRTKWILKEVSKQFIPLEIANRIDKRGFSAPLNIWFGWDQAGKYDRTGYKREAFDAWKQNYFYNHSLK
ncbi:asparagine synthase C-terminal domain-containing protein, partial [bacterium]|nr:asparagine synthase C-terminal domain-containing protein [bacterium]